MYGSHFWTRDSRFLRYSFPSFEYKDQKNNLEKNTNALFD
ncbi:hypothetical protein T06_2293 [Trichinella sp. T6]|nr:hypothetical protein T06_2293 [Trichinella sp. T6]